MPLKLFVNLLIGHRSKCTRCANSCSSISAKIKEVILTDFALDDEKREEFNKIEQELEKLSLKFSENVLDATKKFEKLITDKKKIEGLPPSALGLFTQAVVSKGYENATSENGQ